MSSVSAPGARQGSRLDARHQLLVADQQAQRETRQAQKTHLRRTSVRRLFV